ncbi:MAG: FprA family A-type flavoprotein [Dysgonamonadaceae bacterium]|jgi:flavorubredoxin|nr:FprA family A-type flavoprotein [Dysgonamonadaceae bacterium]
MNFQIPVSGQIYWIGENDRRKRLFENIWPLPQGVAYNAYLINDEKTALIDTIDVSVADDFLDRLAYQLQNKSLDYLIINHAEPDHAGMIGLILKQYPNLRIVGNKKTFKILEAYFGLGESLIEVKDGDVLELGRHRLQFYMTPWVHWPETMMTYDTTDQVLFSGDAFGAFGAFEGGIFDDEMLVDRYEDEARRYFSNIVGQYSNMVQKALAKLQSLPLRTICPTHGPVWREAPAKVVGWYDRWSRYEGLPGVVVAFASMYGSAEKMADYIARKIAEQGVREIRVLDVSKTHLSFLLSEIWKYQGVVLGSCTYNNELHPMMETLCNKLLHIHPGNKIAGVFGTYSWNGGAIKHLQQTMEALNWPLASEAVEIQGNPDSEKIHSCDNLASAMASAIKK